MRYENMVPGIFVARPNRFIAYVEIDGNWITGVDYINSSSFTVYVTVGDDVYSCVIRVQ